MPKTPPYSEQFSVTRSSCTDPAAGRCSGWPMSWGSLVGRWRTGSSRLTSTSARREGLSSDEREELRRLRRELKVVTEERDILKKAAAFFAKESGTR